MMKLNELEIYPDDNGSAFFAIPQAEGEDDIIVHLTVREVALGSAYLHRIAEEAEEET